MGIALPGSCRDVIAVDQGDTRPDRASRGWLRGRLTILLVKIQPPSLTHWYSLVAQRLRCLPKDFQVNRSMRC